MDDKKEILKQYVETANNPEYKSDWNVINSKFPELKGSDPQILKEYVETANNPKYESNFDTINSKFPELFGDEKKNSEPSSSLSEAVGQNSPRGAEQSAYAAPSTYKKPQAQNDIVTGITAEHFANNPLFSDANPNGKANKDIYLNNLKAQGFDVQPTVNAENVRAEQKDNPDNYSGFPYLINKAYKYTSDYLTNAGTGILKSAEKVNNSLAQVLTAQKGSEVAQGATGALAGAAQGVLSGAQVVSPELAAFTVGTDAIKHAANNDLSPEHAKSVEKVVDFSMQIVSVIGNKIWGEAEQGSIRDNLQQLGNLAVISLAAKAAHGAPEAIKDIVSAPKSISELKDISAKVANGEIPPSIANHLAETADNVSINDIIKEGEENGTPEQKDIVGKIKEAQKAQQVNNAEAQKTMSPELIDLHKQKEDLQNAKTDEFSAPIIEQQKAEVENKINEQEKSDDANVANEGIKKAAENHLSIVQDGLEKSIKDNEGNPTVTESLQKSLDDVKQQKEALNPKPTSEQGIINSFASYTGDIPYQKIVDKVNSVSDNLKGDPKEIAKVLTDNNINVTDIPKDETPPVVSNGKEIEPHKEVSASKSKALKEIAPIHNLKEMEAGVLYQLKDMSPEDIYKKLSDDKSLQGAVGKKLIDKGFLEDDGWNDKISISDKGKNFIDATDARLETRKRAKEGTDLFPEDANIPEFKAINKHIKDGNITEQSAESFITAEPKPEHEKLISTSNEQIQNPGNYSTKELQQTADGITTATESGKEESGMAAPAEGDVDKSSGVSQKSLNETSKKFGIESPKRGAPTTPEEQIARGRELLKKGADPEKVLNDFKEDAKISADAMATVRAHKEQLVKDVYKAVDEHGENSPQDKEARKKLELWQKETKPMATVWNAIGEGMQGKTNVDTGTYTGMREAFKEHTGKDFTPEQTKVAKELSKTVKKLSDEVESLKNRLTESIENSIKEDALKNPKTYTEKAKNRANEFRKGKIKDDIMLSGIPFAKEAFNASIEAGAKIIEAGGKVADAIDAAIKHLKSTDAYKSLNDKDKINKVEKLVSDNFKEKEDDLFTKFVDKNDNKFTNEEVREIWNYAKSEYIDKGVDYNNMLTGVSKDLSLSPSQIRAALSQPKGAKVITDEMYRTQNRRNTAIKKAKDWIQTTDLPKVTKFIKAIPNAFFQLKTFGHGTVGMITHTGMNIFKPTSWTTYFPNFIKQFKFAFGDVAEYEKAMDDLKSDPDYTFWKRNGLAVDPDKKVDDYQALEKNLFGKLGVIGDKGFNALKVWRLETAKSIYEGLSNIEKSDPNSAKEIAKIVNHSSGTADVPVPKALSTAFFAPRLEASRWARLIVQPSEAIGTIAKMMAGKDVSPSEKVAAKLVAKRSGEMIATYAALLAVNQGLLSLSASKNKVNFTDPSKSDWLKFKIGDYTVDVSAGMESALRFTANLIKLPFESKKELHGQSVESKMVSNIGEYVKGKLSPVGSFSLEVYTKHDYSGNTMPWSKEKPLHYWNHKLTWKEYLWSQSPIPSAEAAKEVYKSMEQKGMSRPQIEDYFNGIFVGLISGGTGTRISTNYKNKK